VLHDFAEFLLFQENKPGAAAEQYLKALPIRRARQDDKLAWTLRNLGYALRRVGKAKEAEAYLRESLAVSQKLGPSDLAWLIEQLTGALCDQGKLAEAEILCRDELMLQRKKSGSEHPQVASALQKLGDVLRDSGKWAEAKAVFRELWWRIPRRKGSVEMATLWGLNR